MKFMMHRLPKLVAAGALVASFAAAAQADNPGAPPAFEYQAPQGRADRAPPVAGPQAGRYGQVPVGTCFYSGYNPHANLGQGSGASLGRSQLVCP
jgi:hypothetical protein